ncbi:MAG: hypothetical protein ACRDH7_07155 [Actinomycetota bacterium]
MKRFRSISIIVVVAIATLGLVPGTASAVASTTPDSTWQTNGRVNSIVQIGGRVYVGGTFTQVMSHNGQVLTRNRLAAFDASTGIAVSTWDPNASGAVYSLAASPTGDVLYAGGSFTRVKGIIRKKVVAIDPVTGSVLAWNPAPDKGVWGIATLGSKVYLGGDFSTVGGLARTRLAAVNAGTGTVDPSWTPSSDGIVRAILPTPDGTKIMVGGEGHVTGSTGGTSQNRIAALDPLSGASLPWASHPGYDIRAFVASSTTLFAAGEGGGGHAPAYDINTGALKWTGFTDGDLQGIALLNGVLYVGGHFQKFSGVERHHMAALDPVTGALRSDWLGTANSSLGVFSMLGFGSHLYIGGDFTLVSGVSQQHFAQFTDPGDTSVPTVPGTPSGVSNSPTSIDLTWAASSDTDNVTLVYNVYRDGGSVPIGTITSNSSTTVGYHDDGLSPGSTHTYAVDASDGVNTSAPSPSSGPITVQAPDSPVLISLRMFDGNQNGKVDQVVASFSEPVSCTVPCLTPWTLQNVPSGGNLLAVSVAGSQATLTLAEGAGAADTSIGAFRVTLAAALGGIVDTDGNPAGFAATAPADLAGPVPVSITDTNGSVDGQMQAGDTLRVTFSEALDPASLLQANIKETDPTGVGNDSLVIVGLTNGSLDLGSDNYITGDGLAAVFQNSTLALTNANRTVVSTVAGACSGTGCANIGTGGPGLIVFVPEPILLDGSGNGAVGSLTVTLRLY